MPLADVRDMRKLEADTLPGAEHVEEAGGKAGIGGAQEVCQRRNESGSIMAIGRNDV